MPPTMVSSPAAPFSVSLPPTDQVSLRRSVPFGVTTRRSDLRPCTGGARFENQSPQAFSWTMLPPRVSSSTTLAGDWVDHSVARDLQSLRRGLDEGPAIAGLIDDRACRGGGDLGSVGAGRWLRGATCHGRKVCVPPEENGASCFVSVPSYVTPSTLPEVAGRQNL